LLYLPCSTAGGLLGSMWAFAVDEWCNPDVAGATLRVTAEDGRHVEAVLPPASRPVAVAGLP
jgi:hypothetical protein